MLKTITPKPKIHFRQIVTTLVTKNGDVLEIYECIHSGRVITREKIDTLTKVFHPGIIIGEDQYGRRWVAHNHYLNKHPMFDLIEKFSEGKTWLWDPRSVNYDRDEIVERAI
ncbi:MAG TPA: hypothetical protein VI461_15200, partial [Chitinophagaceae bacterium]|nr:hypothetical protein [Chitinophagaceae bacterium]